MVDVGSECVKLYKVTNHQVMHAETSIVGFGFLCSEDLQ
jgi:hypothetical protein